MTRNCIELETVSSDNDWMGGEESQETFEGTFNLRSDNAESEDDDNRLPEASGTITYKMPFPHGSSLDVLNGRLTNAVREVAHWLPEWAEDAKEHAQIGKNLSRKGT